MAGAPKLIVLSEQLRGKSFELNKDLHTVGRVEERDICIKDPTISTYHCDFIKTENTYILRDKGSTNGTRVNNVPITEQELQNSDILQVGGVEILYDCDDKSVTTVMRTQTGIDLEGANLEMATVKKMENVSPFKASKNKGAASKKIVLIMISLLAVIIVGLIGFVIYLIMNQGSSVAS
jgi:pSer/pThr/pTyr-binding forkhead associated (FHA) protein